MRYPCFRANHLDPRVVVSSQDKTSVLPAACHSSTAYLPSYLSFETFSGLRVLVIDGGGSLDALWEGLARATTASLDRARDGLKAGVCCPRLSEIAIGGTPAAYSKFSASSTLFERVREALDARADAGATPLKKLQLHLEYTGPLWCKTPKNIELREAFVEDVKTLVEELDYSDLWLFQRRLARARSSRVRNDPLWLVSHLPD